MSTVKATKENIIRAAKLIKAGKLVAFPTETVYGLGADGLNELASAKIFEVKQRPSFNPLILHIASIDQLELICDFDQEIISKLIEKFWPGPLTLVLPKKDIVPEIITGGNPTVAVRMPSHKVALDLIKLSETPIAAPSANVFNRLSPTTAEHVYNQLDDKVDLILDGGITDVGIESTILKIDDEISLLRPGGLPIEEIEKITGKIKRIELKGDMPLSPGQLPFHYSPTKPLRFLDEVNKEELEGKRIAGLFFKKKSIDYDFKEIRILSPKGSLIEAAAKLFKHLHYLEKSDIDIIIAEPIEESNLGLAIMDRLRKAANRYR